MTTTSSTPARATATATATVTRPAAPPVSLWNDPACGASLFLTLLHLVFVVFSAAFRRDNAAPVPEAPFAPEAVPDLTTLHSQKTALYDDAIFFSTPSIASTLSNLSTGATAATRSELSTRLSALFRPTGLTPFRAFQSPSHSASLRTPHSALLNLSVSCLLTSVSSPPHSAFQIPHSHPPPPS